MNINAADWNKDVITYSATNLPKGATVDSANHSFSWTPGYDQAGTYNITLIVSDGTLQSSKTLILIIKDLNSAPVMSPIADKTTDEGKLLTFVVTATDPEGDQLTYSASGLPVNAIFNPANKTFSWTPAFNQAGEYSVTFTVNDGSMSDSKILKISVNTASHAPVFGPLANASVNQKEVLNFPVTASDPDGDVLTYSASNLPTGASFNPATRQFTWSPAYNQIGNYTVTFHVSDGTLSTSRDVTFTAIKVNYAPYFTLGSVTTLTYNEGYPIKVNINAADWNKDVITYSATNLPKGAMVDSATHSFSWTPGYDQAGTYNITLIVSDGTLQSSKSLILIIKDINTAPVMSPLADKTTDEGKLLTFVVIATDPEGDLLTYSASGLPANAVFNPANKTFSWTPAFNQAGSYNVTFTVNDGSLQDSKSVKITVKNINSAPVMSSIADKTTDEGKLLTFVVTATDPEGDLLTYSASGLPANAVFNPANQTFSWTPAYNQAGSYNVTFTVSDGSLQDSKSVNITVNDSNNAPVFGSCRRCISQPEGDLKHSGNCFRSGWRLADVLGIQPPDRCKFRSDNPAVYLVTGL